MSVITNSCHTLAKNTEKKKMIKYTLQYHTLQWEQAEKDYSSLLVRDEN